MIKQTEYNIADYLKLSHEEIITLFQQSDRLKKVRKRLIKTCDKITAVTKVSKNS